MKAEIQDLCMQWMVTLGLILEPAIDREIGDERLRSLEKMIANAQGPAEQEILRAISAARRGAGLDP